MNEAIDAAARAAADEAIAALEARGRRCTTGPKGQRVVWRVFGDGPALVLLHGGHGSWLHWARNLPALSSAHRVLVPDMPGFGESDDLPGPKHAEDRLDRLVQALADGLIELIGADAPLTLAGFSFGGLVAAVAAAQWKPDRPVYRLVLLGPGGHGQRRPRTIAFADWRQEDPLQRRAALRENLLAFMFHDAGRADALATVIHERACEATRFRSKALSIENGLWAALAGYDGPLHLIWGEHDVTAVPTELGAQLLERHPHARFDIVAGAGHWVAYEAAEAVDRLLLHASDPN